MKIVVIGGTGLIGTKLASRLRDRGHDVIQAAPSTGVNTITGDGLDKVLSGAEIVVDTANSPSKQQINTVWIYPPRAERAAALASADPEHVSEL